MGAALVAPRVAMAAADADAAAAGRGGGKASGDLTWLIVAAVVAVRMPELVMAGWLGVEEGPWTGLRMVGMVIGGAVLVPLVAVLVIGAVVWVVAGKGRREAARDFDLASVAMVPWMVVWAVAGDGWAARAVGGAWVVIGVGVAVAVARGRNRRPATGDRRPETGNRWVPVAGGLAVVAVLMGVGGWNAVWIGRNWELLEPVGEGDVAPGFVLPELGRDGKLTGATVDLGELRGRVVLLDFWAEWCGPCRDALPWLDQLHERFGKRGFTVLSVKTDGDDLGRAETAVKATRFPLVLDEQGVAGRYQVTVIPHMVLVDREGIVRGVYRGDSTGLVKKIERLLAR